jgi:hypothetical protein
MEEIIDEIKDNEQETGLNSPWKGLKITIAIIMILISLVLLLAGILNIIDWNNYAEYALPIPIYMWVRTIVVLILFPIALLTGAILFFTTKKLGWYLCLIGSLFIASFGIYGIIDAPKSALVALVIITIFFGAISVTLWAKAYRMFYKFQLKFLLFIIPPVLLLLLITIFKQY